MRLFRLLLAVISWPLCTAAQVKIELANPVPVARVEEVIEIPWVDMLRVYPGIDTAAFVVTSADGKQQLPVQLLAGENKQTALLFLQVSLGPGARKTLLLSKGKRTATPAKTYCRYVPERKDDFAWENDKIAFRAYGAALEALPAENAYGLDVWVKEPRAWCLTNVTKKELTTKTMVMAWTTIM
ncbi:MAG: DUF4861 family protein [Flavihumibacter sp.]